MGLGCRVATSHTVTKPFNPAAANSRPSGENASCTPLEYWQSKKACLCRVARSHQAAVPSPYPIAKIGSFWLSRFHLLASGDSDGPVFHP
jgi:hypothetical protein